MERWLQNQWSGYSVWHLVLLPLSWLFLAIVSIRLYLYRKHWLKSHAIKVPVIVVGNINVGGTGKTPLVIYLVQILQMAGYKPGIISRGYGGSIELVSEVFADSSPQQMGDEPVLIAKRTCCPVFVGANRVAAANALLTAHPDCTVIISDDGLQHYQLQRDVELVVFEATKGFGNGMLLPAGPLREPLSRLRTVDAVIVNGQLQDAAIFERLHQVRPFEMHLESNDLYNLLDGSVRVNASALKDKHLLAIAGIGNPKRFFAQLQALGLHFEARSFADHHQFSTLDCQSMQADAVVMTEKDAVKCQAFAQSRFWVLPVNANVDGLFANQLITQLKSLNKGH